MILASATTSWAAGSPYHRHIGPQIISSSGNRRSMCLRSARLARSDRCQLILGNQLRMRTGGFVMKVGFVGLGRMGSGMAASLLKAGHEVIVYNRTPAKAEPLIRNTTNIINPREASIH